MRSARLDDAAALATLWAAAGLHFRTDYVERELELALARNPDLVIVDDGPPPGLAGSVFGTFDGRRGWLNRLATDPARRGLGVATALVRELERRLAAHGCLKINLLVEPGNAGVIPFYERLGFRSRTLIFMDKWIAGPASASGPASAPGSGAWTGLEPALHPDPYVFAAVLAWARPSVYWTQT